MSKVQKKPPICVCEHEREKRKRMIGSVEVVLKCVVKVSVGNSVVAGVCGAPQ